METIKCYVENIFATLPRSEQVLKLKEELLSTMEDKYNELKADGKSEHEAIGIVISEFGSIEELKSELGLEEPSAAEPQKPEIPVVSYTAEEAESYVRTTSRLGFGIGLGVMLLIFAFGAYTLVLGLMGYKTPGEPGGLSAPGAAAFLACIVASFALIISCGMVLDKLDKKSKPNDGRRIELPADYMPLLEKKSSSYNVLFGITVALGVALFAASPIVLLAAEFKALLSLNLRLSVFLAVIGLGVLLITCAATKRDSLDYMLDGKASDDDGDDDNDDERLAKKSPFFAFFNASFFPCVLTAYFLWSFLGSAWKISWVIFPAAICVDILVKGICTACVTSRENKQKQEKQK